METEDLTAMEYEVLRVLYDIETFNEENILKFIELRTGKNINPEKTITQVSEILQLSETVVKALERSALQKLFA